MIEKQLDEAVNDTVRGNALESKVLVARTGI